MNADLDKVGVAIRERAQLVAGAQTFERWHDIAKKLHLVSMFHENLEGLLRNIGVETHPPSRGLY